MGPNTFEYPQHIVKWGKHIVTMCHKNRAEEIKSLWDRMKFVKLNSCTIYGNAREFGQEK